MRNYQFPWLTFLMLISFASVNAVIPSPALPEIAHFFYIDNGQVQLLMSTYLIGYAIGQLIYGPIANRFGRKPALYLGIILQIASSIGCISAGGLNWFFILPIARFFMAIGAGVGLKMTFTLINETCGSTQATKKMAILIIAFALAPGLAVCLSSVFLTLWSWKGCFYFSAAYGCLLLVFVSRLAETLNHRDFNALNPSYLLQKYQAQFRDNNIRRGGILIGCASTFIYLFATWAPLIAINQYSLTESTFALMNLAPTFGMLIGAFTSARLTSFCGPKSTIIIGIIIAICGVLVMLYSFLLNFAVLYALFLPMALINFALSLIFANASSLALQNCSDKSNGSAVLNFINMGMAALLVLSIGLLPASFMLLLAGFAGISIIMTVTLISTGKVLPTKLNPSQPF